MSWPKVTLDNICTLLSGNAWSASKFKDEGIIPIIRIQNLGNNLNEKFIWWNESYDNRFVVTKGDILLSLSGSIKIDIWNGEPALLNQRIVKMTPNDGVDNRWFYWQINSIILEIEKMGKWALVNNVSITDLKLIKIPLPPLETQKRIADILDAADALRKKDQELLKKYDELAQAIFIDMFGDPVKNEKGWEVKLFDEFIEYIGDIGSNGSNEVISKNLKMLDVEDYAIMVRTTNLANDDFAKNIKYVSQETYNFFKKSKVFGGEIIMNKIGSAGDFWIMPNLNKPVSLGLNQLVIRLKNLNTKYLFHYLSTPYGKHIIKSSVNGAVTKSITKGAVKNLSIIYPSILIQEKFEKRINQVESLRKNLTEASNISEKNFHSILQKAFNGELVN